MYTDPDDIIGHLSFYQLILWIIVTSNFMIPGINNILSVFVQADLVFDCQNCTCDFYNFNTTLDMRSSIKSEWDLICGKSYLSDLATSFYYLGFAIGGIFAGHYAEKVGRKQVLLISTFISIVLSIGLGYTQQFLEFAILRTFFFFFGHALVALPSGDNGDFWPAYDSSVNDNRGSEPKVTAWTGGIYNFRCPSLCSIKNIG